MIYSSFSKRQLHSERQTCQHVFSSHLKENPNRCRNSSNRPSDEDQQGKPEDTKDGILRHGDDQLLSIQVLCRFKSDETPMLKYSIRE